MNALQNETVLQVRRLLLQVLDLRQKSRDDRNRQAGEDVLGADPSDSDSSAMLEQFDIAALVRHELSPAVGWIRLAADSEIETFGASKTNEAVRRLQRRIDGLVEIIKSSEELNLRRLSLPHILTESWPDTHTTLSVSPSGAETSIDIESDEGLLSMLLSNVFQNAIDASTDVAGEARVQATWGCTAQSYWIRVTNPFRGDRFTLLDVLDIGSSSKMAHQGQGLSLIRTVADRLGLAISLEGTSGMASFSLSGSRPDE